MKSRIFIITKILALMTLSIAMAEPGIENQPILVGTSERTLGMETAFTAGPAASSRFLGNPSSLGLLNGAELSVVELPFTGEPGNRVGAFSLAINPHKLGIAMNDVGNFSVASWFDGWGDDSKRSRMMLLGYARSLGSGISAGGNLRHYRRDQDLNTQLGWSFDVGVLFSHKLERLGDRIAFGLSFEDLAGRFWEAGYVVEQMPFVARFDTRYDLDSDTILSGAIFMHNDSQFNWNESVRAQIGAERWFFNKRFGVRVGYTGIANYSRFAGGEWTRGFSVGSETAQIDYTYVSGGDLDQGVHWISATLRWGKGTVNSPITQPLRPSTTDTKAKNPPPIVMPKQPVQPAPELIQRELKISEEIISPNGDGIKDQTAFEFKVRENETWQIHIRDDYSEIVRTYSGTGSPMEVTAWDGRNADGNLVSDGAYLAQLTVSDRRSNYDPQSEVKIVVDTIPADLQISAEPLILDPKRQNSGDTASGDTGAVNVPTVHTQVSDQNQLATWELRFLDSTSNVLDKIRGVGTPPNTLVWSNWHKHQPTDLSNANYRCLMTVHDVAGNRTTQETPLSLIDPSPAEDSSDPHEAVDIRREKRGIVLTLPGVAFDSNSYEVKLEYHHELEETARAINAFPDARVRIEGYTDSMGEASYNLELSRKRANAVMAYLVEMFDISPERLSAVGYGEERPIADDTENEQSKNRRVEIVLLTPADTTGAGQNPKDSTAQGQTEEDGVDDTVNLSGWTVMVSSFKSRENAILLVKSLEALELDEDIYLSEITVKSEPWYRVSVGNFEEREGGIELIEKLKVSEDIKPIVIYIDDETDYIDDETDEE
jgi:outer membrane protein OmpA-like peptidoglycan-associated protein